MYRLTYNGDVVAFKMGRRRGGPSPVTGDNHGSNLTPINGCVGRPPLELNYQLESRMREICQSGSEVRGKAHLCPYPYLSPGFARAVERARRSSGRKITHPATVAPAGSNRSVGRW